MNILLILIIIQLSVLIYLMHDLKMILIKIFELKWKSELDREINLNK